MFTGFQSKTGVFKRGQFSSYKKERFRFLKLAKIEILTALEVQNPKTIGNLDLRIRSNLKIVHFQKQMFIFGTLYK